MTPPQHNSRDIMDYSHNTTNITECIMYVKMDITSSPQEKTTAL